MKFFVKALLALCFSLTANQMYAACSTSDPWYCVENPGKIGGAESLGRYELSVKNLCHKKIWIATHYWVGQDGSSSTLGCVGCKNSDWATDGYWSLEPNEEKLVAVTQNKIIYLHAHSEDKQTQWGTSGYEWELYGNSQSFLEISMGDSFKRWTQSLSCN